MSGGSKASTPSGGSEKTKCENLEVTTILSSPQAEEVAKLEENKTLTVLFSDDRVLAVTKDTGNTVGSINWSEIERLIECIEEGFEYEARVLSIDGGRVRVRVQPTG